MKKDYMKTVNISEHRYNQPNGEIIGIKYVKIDGQFRLCYEVDYLDVIEYIPFSEVREGVYQIVSVR